MTAEQQVKVEQFYAEHKEIHYNVLWEFCEKEQINLKEALHHIAIVSAPAGCKGCKRVGPFLQNHLCGQCSRNFKDYYEA